MQHNMFVSKVQEQKQYFLNIWQKYVIVSLDRTQGELTCFKNIFYNEMISGMDVLMHTIHTLSYHKNSTC